MSAVALAALLAGYQVTLKNPDQFKVQSQSLEQAQDRKVQNLKLNHNEAEIDLVIMGPLDDTQFANYLKLETVSFEHLYAPAITPYPGKITSRQNCDPKMLPHKTTRPVFGKGTDVWTAKANARKSFGSCNKTEAAFDGALSIVHLPNRYAVKTSVFAKSEKAALAELQNFSFAAAP